MVACNCLGADSRRGVFGQLSQPLTLLEKIERITLAVSHLDAFLGITTR